MNMRRQHKWQNVGLDPNFTFGRLLTSERNTLKLEFALLHFPFPVINTLSDSVCMLMSSKLLRVLYSAAQ